MFRIQIDQSNLIASLDDIGRSQIPYSTRNALSRTANLAQTAERNHMSETLHLRREGWVLRSIRIDRSDLSKTSWNVIIYIDPQFLEIANRLETGEDHVPKWGQYFCIPNVDVFNQKIISADNPLHPSNIRLNQHGGRWESTDGSEIFMIHSKATGTPLILQRTSRSGRGVAQAIRAGVRHAAGERSASGQFTQGRAIRGRRPGGTRLLYTLVKRSTVPAKLKFYETITNSIQNNWENEMQQALAKALLTAR